MMPRLSPFGWLVVVLLGIEIAAWSIFFEILRGLGR